MRREAVLEVFPGAELRSPAQAEALVHAEQRLGRALPTDLRQLLLECNGVLGHSAVDTVWSVEQIVEQNLLFRTDCSFAQLYMPFDALLFFGDNGGGDQFAFVQTPQRPDVFVWEHETDSRRWVARDPRDYLGRSLAEGGDDWYQQLIDVVEERRPGPAIRTPTDGELIDGWAVEPPAVSNP